MLQNLSYYGDCVGAIFPAMAELPRDFGARLQAARGYAGSLSRKKLAERINQQGASESTIRDYETKKGPPPASRDTFIAWVAEATGVLPSFFYGGPIVAEGSTSGPEEVLGELIDQMKGFRSDQEKYAKEVLRRLDDKGPPSAPPQDPLPQSTRDEPPRSDARQT